MRAQPLIPAQLPGAGGGIQTRGAAWTDEAGGAKERQPSVLLVMADPEYWRPIVRDLEAINIAGVQVETCRDAREALQAQPEIRLVITDVSLGDGNWCDVFKLIVDTGAKASVVLHAVHADERLWSEAFWRGAYDVLPEPLHTRDVCQIVQGALHAAQSEDPGKAKRAGRSA